MSQKRLIPLPVSQESQIAAEALARHQGGKKQRKAALAKKAPKGSASDTVSVGEETVLLPPQAPQGKLYTLSGTAWAEAVKQEKADVVQEWIIWQTFRSYKEYWQLGHALLRLSHEKGLKLGVWYPAQVEEKGCGLSYRQALRYMHLAEAFPVWEVLETMLLNDGKAGWRDAKMVAGIETHKLDPISASLNADIARDESKEEAQKEIVAAQKALKEKQEALTKIEEGGAPAITQIDEDEPDDQTDEAEAPPVKEEVAAAPDIKKAINGKVKELDAFFSHTKRVRGIKEMSAAYKAFRELKELLAQI